MLVFLIQASGAAFAESSEVLMENASDQGGSLLTIESAIHEAIENNPYIASARAKSNAMMHMPDRVASLDDPRLALNFANFPLDDFGTGNDPMTQIQLGISQNLPFPGKLDLRKSVAIENAQASQIDVEKIELLIGKQVKQVWWQIFYTDRALETIGRNHSLLRQFVEIAQTKYKVGKGIQQDVLLAQLELSKLLDKEIRIKETRRKQQAKLNSILNRPSSRAIVVPKRVTIDTPRLAIEMVLQDRAHKLSPALKAAKKRIDSARYNVQLAKQEKYPDFRVAAIYARRENLSDLASLQIGMSVPLFMNNKQAKLVDQRGSELLQANYTLQDIKAQVDSEISMAYTSYQSSAEQARLFKTGIIPQAQQTVDSMRAGYQVNQVDFLNLVRAQVILYDYETQYWQAISLAKQALAQLQYIVGEESIYE